MSECNWDAIQSTAREAGSQAAKEVLLDRMSLLTDKDATTDSSVAVLKSIVDRLETSASAAHIEIKQKLDDLTKTVGELTDSVSRMQEQLRETQNDVKEIKALESEKSSRRWQVILSLLSTILALALAGILAWLHWK